MDSYYMIFGCVGLMLDTHDWNPVPLFSFMWDLRPSSLVFLSVYSRSVYLSFVFYLVVQFRLFCVVVFHTISSMWRVVGKKVV